MSGLVRVNDVFATEPAVVVTATTEPGVVGVVPTSDVVDAAGAAHFLNIFIILLTSSASLAAGGSTCPNRRHTGDRGGLW